MKFFSKIFAVFISIFILFQFSTINLYPWFKHYGGSNGDWGESIQQTSEGGYIVAGYTVSYSYGDRDFAIYKLDSSGNKVWFKHYGGTGFDHAYSIQQTSDGGYIVAGETLSYTHGSNDFAIYKLNSSGNKVWFKHYGGSNGDYGRSICQTSDGGYIVAGTTESFTYGSSDFAIYRLDSNGNKVWFKHYGGSSDEQGRSIQQTSDGGFIVAGYTESYTYGGDDIALYKLSSNGSKVWFKHYGGSNGDYGRSVCQTSDGGFILAGNTYSYSHGNTDFAIYRLNSSGNKVWFKHYGGTSADLGYSIQQTSDGGYILGGYTHSYTHGGADFAIYRLNSSGNKAWFKHYGGASDDEAYFIKQTSDGGSIITGYTISYSYGGYDIGIYKLDSNGNK